MNCQKCNRKVPANRKTCLYCGESIDQQPVAKKTFTISNGNISLVQSEMTRIMDFADIPENIRTEVESALRKEQKIVTIQDESRVSEHLSNGKIDNRMQISLENTLTLLSEILDSYKQNRITAKEYDKMVLEFIEDFLTPFDDSEKIRFVVNGIKNSKFMTYLSDDILLKLRRNIIGSVSNKL